MTEMQKRIHHDNGRNKTPRTQPGVKRSTENGKFENRRQDCSRHFRNPIGLKEHRAYICTQQETKEHQRETPHEARTQQKVQYLQIQDKEEHAPTEAANQRMAAQEEEENNEKEGAHHGSNSRNGKPHTRKSTEMRWDTWPHWENQDNQKQRRRTRQEH